MTPVEQDLEAGLWVPDWYGSRFRVCRLLGDRRRTQETLPTKYRTLDEARAECDRLNGRQRQRA